MSIDGIRAVDKEPLAAVDYLFGMSIASGQRIGPRPVGMHDVSLQIASALPLGSLKSYPSVAAMNADVTPPAGTLAYAEGKTWRKTTASGSPGWEVFLDFIPGAQIINAFVTGGTANAVVATTASPVSTVAYKQLITLGAFTASNTGAMTVTLNGVTRTLVTNTGAAIPSGYIKAGMSALVMLDGDGKLRLFSYGDASAIQAAAEAAATAAEAAKVAAEAAAAGVNLPPVAPDRMLVDNAAGTARESKTFAQVRQKLQAIPVSELSVLEAWNRGVPGDNTDQTTAVQAIINSLPAEGGRIRFKGDVSFTALDLSGKHNVMLEGVAGGNGRGDGQRTVLRCTAGAIGNNAPAVKMWGTFNVSWRDMMLLQTSGAFNGTFLDYGSTTLLPGEDSALMSLTDVYLQVAGTTNAKGLDLYGATQGTFDRVTFAGRQTLVHFQNQAGVGFCNVHQFRNCNWKPSGAEVPMLGSGEGLSFTGCNVQASSSDHKGRWWETSQSQPFRGISLIGNCFYDQTVGGTVWSTFYWGDGLAIAGNVFGGVSGSFALTLGGGGTGGDPQVKGLRGFDIRGNWFNGFSAGISFDGTIANKTNARGGVIGGNSVTNGFLVGSYSTAEQLIILPNSIYSAPTEFGANLSFVNFPTFSDRAAAVAAGYTTGQAYVDTGSGRSLLGVV